MACTCVVGFMVVWDVVPIFAKMPIFGFLIGLPVWARKTKLFNRGKYEKDNLDGFDRFACGLVQR
jgi:hypothetical protein